MKLAPGEGKKKTEEGAKMTLVPPPTHQKRMYIRKMYIKNQSYVKD